ncbi:MAG TPA: hypothetical protein VE913_20220 [Longimicrobium sp.]|nr:hypothetical protein [Longimicrobium sp.]
MDSYLFCLILGFAGLVVMSLAGFGHGGGHSHGHGHGGHDAGDLSLHAGHAHAGHGHTHAGHAHAGHGHGGHHAGNAHHHGDGHHGSERGGGAGSWFLQLLSPRVLFSVLVGLGATGMLARPYLSGIFLFLAALLGGVAFERVLVAPLWSFLFRFASAPALTMESSLLDTATAVTGFDARGDGVVSLEVDGQVLQILATLRPEDRAAGLRVRAGDQLLVESVDGARNRCVVSWTGTSLPAGGR